MRRPAPCTSTERMDATHGRPTRDEVEAPEPEPRRTFERTRVSSRAVLHFRGATHPCRVRDVSPHGAGVDMDAQPRVGDEVCLVLTEIGGAPALTAVVRHVTGARVGLEFPLRGEATTAIADELARRFRAGEG